VTIVLPAVLAAAAVAVALGLPQPRRRISGLTGPRSTRAGVLSRLSRVPGLLLPVAVLVGLLLPMGPVGAAVAAALSHVARLALRTNRARRARRLERLSAAEAMAVLASELRAGRSPTDALRSAAGVAEGATADALDAAAAAGGLGGSPHEVLALHADRCAAPELLRGLGACWQVCQGMGSSLAAAVDRLEEALDAERVRFDVVEAELAGPRTTAALLAVLPGFGILMAAGLGAHPVHVLLHTAIGSGCLAVGVALDLLGLWWTGRIVASAGGAP
jgi:tight adherence protein B